MRFKDKTVVITGASRGIGAQTAIQFAKEGANIVLDYFVSDYELDAKENVEEVKKEIEKLGVKVIAVNCDVRDETQIKELVKATEESIGKIDVLVNNAGYVIDCPISERTLENWHRTIDTNLLGTYLCIKIISEGMNDGGSIVNASSANGVNYNNPESIDYDASKAGIISLTKNFAKELGPRNIRVNATALGWANTEMNQQLPKDFVDKEISKTYLKRIAKVEEIANLTLFLASNDSSYITGETIMIDGGVSV